MQGGYTGSLIKTLEGQLIHPIGLVDTLPEIPQM